MSVCEGSVTLDQIFPFSIYTGIKAICWVKHSLLCPVVNLHLMRNFYLAGWSALSAEHRRWRVDPTRSWTGAKSYVRKIVQIFPEIFWIFPGKRPWSLCWSEGRSLLFLWTFLEHHNPSLVFTDKSKNYEDPRTHIYLFLLLYTGSCGKFLDLWILKIEATKKKRRFSRSLLTPPPSSSFTLTSSGEAFEHQEDTN